MIKRFKSYLAQRAPEPPQRAAIPVGQRVYAVGDIHGRLDLFEALIAKIDADDARRGPAETTVILLGDLVDRGPDSRGVIAAARSWASRRAVRMLKGNHEEMFLKSFSSLETLRHFLRYGGKETLLSYPIDPRAYQDMSLEALQARLPALIPAEDVALMEAMEDVIAIGDYLFVHAGIRPGVALDEQRRSDLRWIREPFIDHEGDHGVMVVHGHTITSEVEELPNRIGIDTGAFMSGRLTALGLEGTDRWYLAARDAIARADDQAA
ncbi:MAG TPA: metallophosphoesterase family protein [Novosphingobium sp.]|nr:metallophosphoesterase family protein [Novosphingobium sp.]